MGNAAQSVTHTPSIAFRHLPPKKDVVNQCLEFETELEHSDSSQLAFSVPPTTDVDSHKHVSSLSRTTSPSCVDSIIFHFPLGEFLIPLISKRPRTTPTAFPWIGSKTANDKPAGTAHSNPTCAFNGFVTHRRRFFWFVSFPVHVLDFCTQPLPPSL